ncbi:MAG: hypothetical protein HOY79_29795, partial [Streptomyces sp.]|nr:hypothetical protein [Streptomyces sp.]
PDDVRLLCATGRTGVVRGWVRGAPRRPLRAAAQARDETAAETAGDRRDEGLSLLLVGGVGPASVTWGRREVVHPVDEAATEPVLGRS